MNLKTKHAIVILSAVLAAGLATPSDSRADIILGLAANYTVIENNNAFTMSSGGTVNGNIGVGGTGTVDQGNGFINGNVDFSAANTGQFNKGNGIGNPTVSYNVSNVTSAVNTINTLSATSATNASGAPIINLGSNPVIDITTGKLVNGTYYFNLGSASFNGRSIDIQGSASQSVVFNVASNMSISGGSQINLSGGLTSDDVLFNIVGGNSLSVTTGSDVSGIFLDSLGTVQIRNASSVLGHVFGGGPMNIDSGASINAPSTVPEPGPLMLAGIGLATLLSYGWLRRRRAAPAP